MIREISWYLPNTPGEFSRVLKALADAGVNIRGFSVDLSTPYSKVRLACDDVETAKKQFTQWEYAYEETEVFALSIPDAPGQLLRVADLLGRNDINIEYGYVTLGPKAGEALVILKTNKEEQAKRVFAQAGFQDHDRIPNPPRGR
jgi:hypothetical protein